MREMVIYQDKNGDSPFKKWILSLKDKSIVARIHVRLFRVEYGNLGDYKILKDGLIELRFHFGSGYRVYLGLDGDRYIVLLSGGDKSSQGNDIKKAQLYLRDYFERKQYEKKD